MNLTGGCRKGLKMTKLDKKIERVIKTNTLAYICPDCKGCGWDYDEDKICGKCGGDGLVDWDYGQSAKEIKKTILKEIMKNMPKSKDDSSYNEALDDCKNRILITL